MVPSQTDVVVVGAGAIGACVAYELTSAGMSVIVIERGRGWAEGCSRGNAGYISPGHAGPFAALGDIARAVRWLANDTSPFGLVPSVSLASWLFRMLRAGGPSRVAQTSALLLDLAGESLELHAALDADGLQTGFSRAGLIDVYLTSRAFAGARRAAVARNQAGASCHALGPADTLHEEPLLRRSVAGAVLHPDEAYCDPLGFVTAVGNASISAGAQLVPRTEVTGIREVNGHATVHFDDRMIRCESVVVAAGADSPALARGLPIAAGDGYSTLATDTVSPKRPLMVQEDRLAVTPVAGGMRLAGSMVLRAFDHEVDGQEQSRLHGITVAARRSLELSAGTRYSDGWAGARPCTPDGLPIVGHRPGSPRVVVASGHAMLGLTLAPVTGKLVRSLLQGAPDRRLPALREERFR